MKSNSTRGLALAWIVASGAACVEEPAARVEGPVARAPARAPSASARWIDAGPTFVGPLLADGRLVLVGGRRALVGPRGVRFETAPSPERFERLVAVPIPGALDRLEVVASSATAVYRLSDPLGEPLLLARVDETIRRLGAAPGVVLVWGFGSLAPRAFDVGTGAPAPLPGPAGSVPTEMMFVDANNGVGAFAGSGLAATTDGGATYRPFDDGTALTAHDLAPDPTRKGLLVGAADHVARADARFTPYKGVPGDAPPLLRWIEGVKKDPLALAAAGGIALSGELLVADHGLLARLDPATGAPLDVVAVGRGDRDEPCTLADVGGPLVACTLFSNSEALDTGLFTVAARGPHAAAGKVLFQKRGPIALRSSPSGGVMLEGSCPTTTEDIGAACARQPDGAWKTVRSKTRRADLDRLGVGPLAGGRVAFVTGFETEYGSPRPASEIQAVEIIALDANGGEAVLTTIELAGPPNDLRVASPIEEDAAHALHLVLRDRVGAEVVIAQPGQAKTVAKRIGAADARLHGSHGIAVGPGVVLLTRDGGASWVDAEPPPHLRAWTERARSVELHASDVGATVGESVRVGWGPAASAWTPKTPSVDRSATDMARAMAAGAGSKLMTCATAGGTPRVAPRRAASPRLDTPSVSTWADVRAPLLERKVELTVDAPPHAPGSSAGLPRAWTFRWSNPLRIGEPAHTETLRKLPPLVDARVVGATLAGARAVFRLDGRVARSLPDARTTAWFVRLGPGEEPEIVELEPVAYPADGGVVFGQGPPTARRGAVLAWLSNDGVTVWKPGETPREIAQIFVPETYFSVFGHVLALGAPTAAGVAVVLDVGGSARTRVLPFAARADVVPIAGWSPLRFSPNGALDPTVSPPCSKGATGTRVSYDQNRGALVELDGAPYVTTALAITYRVEAGSTCVASIAAHLHGMPRADAPPSESAPVINVDFEAGTAESVDVNPVSTPRRLTCSLR